MPATATELARFRRKLAAPDFDEDEVHDIFDETAAKTKYAGYSREVIFAAALIEGIDNLLVAASKRTTYSAGASSESHSDIFRALYKMREKFEAELKEAMTAEAVPIGWGSARRFPSRKRELPDDFNA